MRTISGIFLFVAIGLPGLVAGAYAQQCQQCAGVEVCFREYAREVAKLRTDHIRTLLAQRKDTGQPPPANQDINFSVQTQIDRLKDCLSSIR